VRRNEQLELCQWFGRESTVHFGCATKYHPLQRCVRNESDSPVNRCVQVPLLHSLMQRRGETRPLPQSIAAAYRLVNSDEYIVLWLPESIRFDIA
jgi:hypothetical protein